MIDHLRRLCDYPSLLVSSTAKTALMEISRLTAERDRLRVALEKIAAPASSGTPDWAIARAALKETSK